MTDPYRNKAEAVIADLKRSMGPRLSVRQSDSDFVTDMATALRVADGRVDADGVVEEAKRFSYTSRTMVLERSPGDPICRLPRALFDKLVEFGIERGFGGPDMKVFEGQAKHPLCPHCKLSCGSRACRPDQEDICCDRCPEERLARARRAKPHPDLPDGWKVDRYLEPNVRIFRGDELIAAWSHGLSELVFYPPGGRVSLTGIATPEAALARTVEQAQMFACHGFEGLRETPVALCSPGGVVLAGPPKGTAYVFPYLFRNEAGELRVSDASGEREPTEDELEWVRSQFGEIR